MTQSTSFPTGSSGRLSRVIYWGGRSLRPGGKAGQVRDEGKVGEDPMARGSCRDFPGRSRLGMHYKDDIYSFTHSVYTHLLSTYYVPDTWNIAANKSYGGFKMVTSYLT